MSERMLERMPEIMLAKDVRRYVRKECQKERHNRPLEEISEDMSEKDVRRYARRNVTKNVFIERSLLNSRCLGA